LAASVWVWLYVLPGLALRCSTASAGDYQWQEPQWVGPVEKQTPIKKGRYADYGYSGNGGNCTSFAEAWQDGDESSQAEIWVEVEGICGFHWASEGANDPPPGAERAITIWGCALVDACASACGKCKPCTKFKASSMANAYAEVKLDVIIDDQEIDELPPEVADPWVVMVRNRQQPEAPPSADPPRAETPKQVTLQYGFNETFEVIISLHAADHAERKGWCEKGCRARGDSGAYGFAYPPTN